MSSGSLRLRLVAGGAAAIALALIIAGFALSHLFERHVQRSLATDLEDVLRQAMGAIEIDAGGRPLLRREPADPRFQQPLSGLYWQAAITGGPVTRSRSLWDSDLQLPDDVLGPGEVHHHRIGGPGGSNLLAVERTVMLKVGAEQRPVRITVAADLRRVAEARRSFSNDLLPALSVLGLVLALATWVQIGLGLRPLQRVREAIAEIREGKSRALEGPVPSEVAPLAEEINALLSSQAREMERSAGRAADLAHGLKTPLAALSADVRRLREKGEDDIAQGLEEIGESMRRHIEREMARARIRGVRQAMTPHITRVAPLLRSLVSLQRGASGPDRIAFEIALDERLEVDMDKADLAEVLGNLIENATRHAKSHVRISMQPTATSPRLVIEDDGPGVPEHLRATILKRGERIDERGPGAGLGLAIVQDILEVYGRRLTLETSSLGGLKIMF